MQHRSYRLMSLIAALALTLGTFFTAGAKGDTQSPSLSVGRIFYVSTTGNDSNAGTASAPFRTFSKAVSMLAAGDELQIYGGTYTQQLNVTKSGTASAPITIKAVPGQTVIIDGGGSRDALVLVPAGTSYVNLKDLTCKRASVVCVLLRGARITVSGFDVSEAKKFGIRLTGSYITVENSRIHDNVLENVNATNTTGGWGAALRSAQESGSNNIFRYNEVFHNWGEGIIMGSNTSQVYGNKVYDNYSKNIYIGNTYNVDVYQNITHSTDSRWFRSGNPADCISMSEELISSAYGAQLGNIRVFNNIAANCKSGIGYTYTEVTGNGCNNCLIAFNTITASRNICIKVIPGSKNHIQIVDNICTTRSIDVPSGDISVHHNYMGNASLAGGAIGDPNSYKPNTGSPVISAGVNAGIGTDYFSVSRSRYDIGAIQADSGAVPPTTVPPSPTPIVPTATQVVIPTATPVVTLPPPTSTVVLPTPTAVLPTATLINPTVTVPPYYGTNSLDIRVASGSNDAEEGAGGQMYRGSTDLELVTDSNTQTIGLRFGNVTIPPGATIVNAYIQFKVDEATSTSTGLTISGEAAANAAAFSSTARNITSRVKTATRVVWAPPAWPTVGAQGTDQRTPNLAAIIQEIINQNGWTSGNSLVILITGNGKRVAEAYEGDGAGAALLHIEYSTSTTLSGPSVTPTVSLPVTAQPSQFPPTATPGSTHTALPSDTPTPLETPKLIGTPTP
ncbi:MAG: right-handed parallel beta-helix repeat-containing protein [Chloroflexota bacterium]